MTDRAKRVKTLLRVAAVRKKQAQAELARAEADRRQAEQRRQHTVERLAEATSVPFGTVSSLQERRQRTDLRIDAVLDANQVLAATAEEVEAARLRWQAAARNERSMEELDRRERAIRAVQAVRLAERAADDALRARRAGGGTPT
jgi:hypothetical protein